MLTSVFQLYKQAYQGLSRNSWVLSAVMLVNRSGTMVVAFMSIYCIHQLHFSLAQAGIVMMLFGVGSIFGGYFGGLLTDYIGFYELQVSALITGGLMFIALGFQQTFISVAIGVLILSLCNESFRPANSTAIAFYSSPENKTRSISLNRLAINLGWAVGGSLGGLLAGINYNLLFWVDGGTNILAATLLILLMPKSKTAKTNNKRQTLKREDSPYFDVTYLVFIFCIIFYFICFYEFLIIIPAFCKLSWHFSEPVIGFLLGLNGLIIAFFEMVIVHNLEGKRNNLSYIVIGALIGACGFGLINILSPSLIAGITVVFTITCSEMLFMPFANSFWIGRSADHNRGRYAAVYSMAWASAQIVAPLLGGVVIGDEGFHTLWWLFAVFSLISGGGLFILYKKTTGRLIQPLKSKQSKIEN